MPAEQQRTPVRRARRSQEQRRTETRAALLGAAAELVAESGVRAVTLARVGERAGYSRGIVTHHFGSKQALLDALAKSSQSGFVPGLGDLPAGLERLVLLISGYVRELGRDGVAGRTFLLLWAEAATAPELAGIIRERDEAFRADLRDDRTPTRGTWRWRCWDSCGASGCSVCSTPTPSTPSG
jgi:AcrR family transcriptional regulator